MKKTLLSGLYLFASFTSQSQCPQREILIDDFSGPACGVSLANADPINTVAQTECTGRPGAISGAADIWIEKNSPVSGGSATTIGYSGYNNFGTTPGAQLISTFSITWDGTDANTDPDHPDLTGPVLLDLTGKTIQLKASIDGIGTGKFVTFVASIWDASGNRSDATLVLAGPRATSQLEVIDLGSFTGTANLTDIRAIQFKQTTNQPGLDLELNRISAICEGSVLPVTLKEFKANYVENAINLFWSTTSETNSDRFELESSTDAHKFQKIGSVPAKTNKATLSEYHFRYSVFLSETTYFRLKMIDLDGSYTYSRIIAIKPELGGLESSAIFPTVFSSSLTLNLTANYPEEVQISIISVDGTTRIKKTAKLTPGDNEVKINNLAAFLPGMYIVKVQKRESAQTFKTIKH